MKNRENDIKPQSFTEEYSVFSIWTVLNGNNRGMVSWFYSKGGIGTEAFMKSG